MRTARARRVGLGLLTILFASSAAHAFTGDARRLGMGGVQGAGNRDLAEANPAYHAMPARPGHRGRTIPLPLGLLQLATNFPTFDPQDVDFSVTRIANLALNPPFFLELSQPGELDGEIAIAIARNEFSMYVEGAEELLRQKPVDVGMISARPLAGLGLNGARAFFAPLLFAEGEVAFDDALHGVLTRGEPVLPDSEYRVTAHGQVAGGSGVHLGYAGGGWGFTEQDGLYMGTYAKYLMGFGLGTVQTNFALSTADTIFGDTDPLDVSFDTTTRHALFGSIGSGFGVDTGIALRTGAFDVGLGLRDLGSFLHWGKTEVSHSYLDDATGQVVTESWTDENGYTLRIPTQSTVHVAWTGTQTLVAADLTTSRWGTTFHLGSERQLGPLAVRAGFLTDANSEVQYAWGFGVGLSRLWMDLGFQTHGRTITGERGLTFGTSLALR